MKKIVVMAVAGAVAVLLKRKKAAQGADVWKNATDKA
jgi:hypothetical protein